MNHQTKFGLILGLGIILFCGILISDHLATRSQADIEAAAAHISDLGNVNPTNQQLEIRQNLRPDGGVGTMAALDAPGSIPIGLTQPTVPQTPAQMLTTPPSPVPPAPTYASYTVKTGDDLGKIAATALGSRNRWKDIVDLNKEVLPQGEKTTLRIGMTLRLPPAVAPQVAAPSPDLATLRSAPHQVMVNPQVTKPTPSTPARTYTIKQGDTLYAIAQKQLGSGSRAAEIQKANPGLNTNNLKPGITIKLPN